MKAPTFPDVRVVGMHFREKDGVPAKSLVANMVPPLTLQYEREPFNPFDANAIKIMYLDQHIGYAEASQAIFISPWIDEGHVYSVTVDSLIEVKRNLHPMVTFAPLKEETAETETEAGLETT